jgi:gliding motility-associated-like protein
MNKIIRISYFGLAVAFSLAASKSSAQDSPQKQTVNTLTPSHTPCNLPSLTIAGSEDICGGGVDTLTVTNTTAGATTYLWEPGGATTPTINVTIGSSTTYTCTATNACGSQSVTITVSLGNPAFFEFFTENNTICSGTVVTIQAIPTAGNTCTYLWANTGATTSSITVTPLVTTQYTCTVFADSTNCSDMDTMTIHVTPSFTSTVGIAPHDSICPGVNTALFVTSSNGGSGIPAPTYTWSTGETSATIFVSPLTTTTYYVLVAGACADTSIAVVLTVVDPIPFITVSPDTLVCPGSIATLSATGSSSYVWSTGASASSINVLVSNDETFTVTGTEGNCSVRNTQQVYVYPPLSTSSYTDSICGGTDVIIATHPYGGNPPYTYAWSTVPAQTTDSITVGLGFYSCVVTDACGSFSPLFITVVPRVGSIPAFYPIPDTIQAGGFVNFVNLSHGAASYEWIFGNGGTSADSAPYEPYNVSGSYLVCLVAYNANGCHDTVCEGLYVYTEKIIIPNVFTPNGDGINDVFHVTMDDMSEYNLKIFNRWGELVFEADSPNIDWTGRSNSGVLESSGTYYYIIQATDYSNVKHNLDGYIQLLR